MWRRLLYILAGLIFLAGAVLLVLPAGEDLFAGYRNRQQIEEFRESGQEAIDKDNTSGGSASDSNTSGGSASADSDLSELMQSYNARIYEEGQSELKDAWSFEQTEFDFAGTGMDDQMIGYLTIPAMELELPLYIGADQTNLSKGAAVLGQTSMPVGGENTNCVIAAHRGYGGTAMFREIEALQPGDKVEITNLWETLSYEVVKSIVIYPDDIDAVKIIPGEDLVTLVTCHPYTKNYQRYVVYCRRSGEGENMKAEDLHLADGVAFQSSQPEIRKEQFLTTAGLVLLAGACLILPLCLIVGKRSAGKKGARRKRRN